MFTQIWMSKIVLSHCNLRLLMLCFSSHEKTSYQLSPLVGVAWLSLKWFDLLQVLYHYYLIVSSHLRSKTLFKILWKEFDDLKYKRILFLSMLFLISHHHLYMMMSCIKNTASSIMFKPIIVWKHLHHNYYSNCQDD
jgi:hypothetical protein